MYLNRSRPRPVVINWPQRSVGMMKAAAAPGASRIISTLGWRVPSRKLHRPSAFRSSAPIRKTGVPRLPFAVMTHWRVAPCHDMRVTHQQTAQMYVAARQGPAQPGDMSGSHPGAS